MTAFIGRLSKDRFAGKISSTFHKNHIFTVSINKVAMDDKIYSLPEESDDLNQVNEPEISYSLRDDSFEKDWQRGISVDEFKKLIFEKLDTVYGRC